MRPFTYAVPASEPEAITAVTGKSGATFLAGGTTLLDLMKLDIMTPSHLVDVNHLALAKIEADSGGGVRIGALARNTDVAENELIQQRYPVLAEALLSGASPQLRNMATVGGNLLQRTRCSYFRDPAAACNKRQPGAGCSAIGGFNRMHAILGGSESCIAANPSDMCVALVALDAVVVTRGPRGERQIPIGDFHLLPGNDPTRESVLENGELVTAVLLPESPFAAHSHYVKVRDRASYAFALTSAAVALQVVGGITRAARIALGGVATKPWRAVQAEKALVGKPPSEAAFLAAGVAAVAGAQPQKSNGFKVELTRRTVVRALQELEGRK